MEDVNEDRKKALEEFLYENPDLEKLEDLVGNFNIFAALNFVDEEIRHSRFLTWLLDPYENHGLGDYFLSSFLKGISMKGNSMGLKVPSVLDIDDWDLDGAEVVREWRKIDILIKSDIHKFLCIVENKVRSGEHDDQLRRYRDIVEREFPEFDHAFVYLTVEGEEPSDPEYISLGYNDIVHLVEGLLKRKKDTVGRDIYTFIDHYREILRRYIVEDSEIQEICRRVYKRHKKALDLIYEFRSDRIAKINELIVGMIKAHPDLILEDSGKKYIRFASKKLDFLPEVEPVWTKNIKRLLLFEIEISDTKVVLRLTIGPGPDEERERLYEIAKKDRALFNTSDRNLRPQYFTIYRLKGNLLTLKSSETYEDFSDDELKEKLEKKFSAFLNSDLREITEIITNQW